MRFVSKQTQAVMLQNFVQNVHTSDVWDTRSHVYAAALSGRYRRTAPSYAMIPPVHFTATTIQYPQTDL
jgi:hypothetical protein